MASSECEAFGPGMARSEAPLVRAWPPNNAIMAGAVLAPVFGGGGGGRGVSHGGGYMAQPLMPPPPRPTNCRQISVAYN